MTGPYTQTAAFNASDHLIVLALERQEEGEPLWRILVQTGMPFTQARYYVDKLKPELDGWIMQHGIRRMTEFDATGLEDCGSDGADAA